MRRNLKLSTLDWKTASKLFRSDVSAIFNCHILFNGADQPPKLFFYQFGGNHLKQTKKKSTSTSVLKVSSLFQNEVCKSVLMRVNVSVSVGICTYMNRHVEIVWLEGVCHFPKGFQRIVPASLLEAKRLLRFTALLQKHINNESISCCSKSKNSILTGFWTVLFRISFCF